MKSFLSLIFSLLFLSGVYSQSISPSGPISFCQGGSQVLSVTGGSPSTYIWKLNGTQVGTNPTYIATLTGNYTVVLDQGLPSELTLGPVVVTVNPLPVPSFTFTNNVCSGTIVQFNSNVNSGTAPFTYAWDFGDGGNSTAQNPTHIYSAPMGCGTVNFIATLIVTDASGCIGSVSNNVPIKQVPDVQLQDQDPSNPFSNCYHNPTTANPNYTLTVLNISPDAGCITTYSLDWGDGTLPTVTNIFPVTHTYTQLGAFNLIITATGSNGCTNSKTYLVVNQSNPAGGLATSGNTIGLCAPAIVPFIISNWQNNSPGTTYNLNFGDGSSIVLTHPLNPGQTPDTVYHTYTTSSCPASSYTATLKVINACDTTTITQSPIQVRIKPTASFTATPNPACIGTNVCFTNTSAAGSYGVCAAVTTTYSWDFGDGNTSPALSPCHPYSSAGTYTVTLTATNGCGSSAFTRQICVTGPPSPSFTIDNASGCTPVAVNTTNTTTTNGSCSPTTYLWSITYAAGFCGNSSLWNFTNGTNASSTNPSFLFINPGTYTITLSANNVCGTFSFSKTITVKKPPTVTINSIANTCAPSTIHPVANVVNCGTLSLTYAWSFPGGSPSSASTLDPGNITYSTAGGYTVTLSVTNECGTTIVSSPLTVSTTPSPVVPSNIVVCAGATVGPLSFTSVPAGATFSWTNSNPPIGLAASGSSNPIPAFTAVNATASPIVATISVTATISGCSSANTFTITVNPSPTVNAVSSQTLCAGSNTAAIAFTGSQAGAVYNWTNNNASIGLAASGTGDITSFTATNAGATPIIATITVTPSFTSSGVTCTGTSKTFNITVNPIPTINSVSNQTLCAGISTTSISFSGTVAGTVFAWANNNAAIGLAANGSGNIPSFIAINGGTTPVTATITVTPAFINSGVTCSGSQITFTITVNPSPTVTTVPNQTICAGSPTATITFTGNLAGAVYNWTNSNPSIGLPASGTGDIASFTATNAGATPIIATITVTPSFTSSGVTCTGTPKTFNITVNPSPTVNSVPNQTLCAGTSTTAISFSGTVAGTVFAWTNNNAAIGLAASGSGNIPAFIAINGGTTPITATITVTPSFTNSGVTCSGSPITFTITVNPSPTVTTAPNQTLCAGSPTTAIIFSGNLVGAVYNWTNNNASIGLAASGTGDIASFTATNAGAAPVIATITVTPSFTSSGVTCTGTPKTFNITVNPIPTVNSVPNQTLCAGTSTTAISFSGTVAGTVFAWGNNNAAIGLAASGSGNIPAFIAINGGTTPVTATIIVTPAFTNSGVTCSGSPITFTITVNPSPTVTTVPNQTICAGSPTATITFTGNLAGAVFDWTNSNPSIGLPASGTGDIASFTATNAGAIPIIATITVTPSFTSSGVTCTGTPKTFTITINPKPSIPAQATSICSGGTFIVIPLNAPPVTIVPGGTTYSWAAPIATGGMTGGTIGTNQANISGTLINPTNTAQTATYTVTPTSGVAGNCVGGDFTITVTVNPQAVVQNEATVICSSNVFTVTPSNATPGNNIPAGTLYTWVNPTSAPPGAITGGSAQAVGQSSISQTLTNITNAPATLTYTVTPVVGGSCPGSTFTVTITVNPKPVIPVQTAVICSGNTFTVAPVNGIPSATTIVPAGTTYTWTNPVSTPPGAITGGSAQGVGQSSISQTLTNTTNASATLSYSVTPTSGAAGNCVGVTFTITVTVNPRPLVQDTTASICSGSSFSVTPSSAIPGNIIPAGTVYTWTNPVSIPLGAITGGSVQAVGQSGISQALTNTINAPATLTYIVTPAAGGACTGPTFTITVTVNPKPAIPAQTATICSGDIFTVTPVNGVPNAATIVPAGTTYTWASPVSAPLGAVTGGSAQAVGQSSISQTLTNITNAPATLTYTVTPTSGAGGNCVGTTYTVTVTVTPKPAIPNQTAAICSGNPFTVSPVNGIPNAATIVPAGTTYTWTNPVSAPLGAITGGSAQAVGQSSINQMLINTINAPAALTYTVTPTSGAGGNCVGATFTVTVTVNPKPSIVDKTTTVCSGLIFSVTPSNGGGDIVPAGTTYSWGVPVVTGGMTGGATGTNQTSISGTLTNPTNTVQTAIYSVTPSVGGNCPGSSFTVTVMINPKPQLISPLIPAPVCTNTPFSYVAISSTGNTTFSWNRPFIPGITNPPASGNGPAINETLINNTTSPIAVSYNFSMVDNGCTNIQTVSLVVNPNAKSQFVVDTNIGCAPYQINQHITVIRYINTNDESQYQWFANGILIGTGLTVPAYSIMQPGDTVIITLIAKSKFGCKDDTSNLAIYTLQRPIPSFTSDRDTACGPASIFFTNTTIPININNGSNYFWDFGNGTTSTSIQPGSIIFQPNPTYGDTIYLVKLKVTTGCDTITVTKPILIQSKPKALFTPGQSFGCSPFTVIFTNTSKGSNISYHWDFGDGGTLNTNSNSPVSHTYNTGIRDTFYVVLTAINNCGTDSLRYAIVVSPNTIQLLFGVNGNELSGCAPHTVHFLNNSNGGTTFFWNFGDGSPIYTTTPNVDTVTHTYFQTGVFTVTLRGTNGCADTTSSLTIHVFAKPVPAFIADKYFVCLGDVIHFTNQTDTATSYLWQFGDGNTSTQVNPQHSYSVPGLYRVILNASRLYPSGSACSDTISHMINVVSGLPGHFNVSDSAGSCAPFSITFSNTNLPAVTTNWDFGDGTIGTGNTITHVYLHAGSYIVSLTALDPGGCTYTSQRPITVSGPDGVLSYTGGFYCNSQQVHLEATVSNTDSLIWNFGDGNILTTIQTIVYHTYALAGTYVPKVTLKSNAGCQFPIQGLDTIKVDKITAGFAWTQQKFCAFTKIQFTDTSRAYFGLNNFNWNFGDGNTGTGNIVSHNYSAPGVYTVKLIIFGNSNCSDTVSHQVSVTISNKPIASIQGDTSGCVFSAIPFNGIIQSADSINIVNWSVSNGVTGNGTPFIVNFAIQGTYTIRLIAGTVNGCFDTVYHTIKINPVPIVTTNDNMNLCLGNTAQLSTVGALQYSWSPVQGLSCINCANPIASPISTTTYVVQGLNSFGCAGYDTLIIRVIQPQRITVSANDSICIGQSVQLMANGADTCLWSPSIGLNSSNISNPVSTPASTTGYRVIGTDAFNCFRDTAYVIVAVGQYPTVKLGPDLILSTGTLYSLNPVIQNGPISSWLWSPATNLTCSTCPSPVATIKDNIIYMVKVTTPYGCSAADTINIKVFCEGSQVFIPNAFTPDGDGHNDILMVRGTGILQVKLFRIFNRWGEIIFEKANFPPNDPTYGWDGTVKGKKVSPDVFVYMAEVICDNGTPYTYKGNTTLLK